MDPIRASWNQLPTAAPSLARPLEGPYGSQQPKQKDPGYFRIPLVPTDSFRFRGCKLGSQNFASSPRDTLGGLFFSLPSLKGKQNHPSPNPAWPSDQKRARVGTMGARMGGEEPLDKHKFLKNFLPSQKFSMGSGYTPSD